MECAILSAQIFSLTIIPSQGDLKWPSLSPALPATPLMVFISVSAGIFREERATERQDLRASQEILALVAYCTLSSRQRHPQAFLSELLKLHQ